MELKSCNSQKARLGLLMNAHTTFQLSSSILRVDKQGTALFQGLKEENPCIFLPDRLRRLIFGYVVQLLILYQLVWKEGNFWVFDPSAPPPPNGGITEFLSKFIPSHIYLIRRQTEPIYRIGAILVSIEQQGWLNGTEENKTKWTNQNTKKFFVMNENQNRTNSCFAQIKLNKTEQNRTEQNTLIFN